MPDSSRWAAAAMLIASTLLLAGCGGSGIGRLDLSGAVTHDGKPVPAGQVRFEPNASKGGSGPVGFARISEGRFDTRAQDKGPVAGPVRVKVMGYVSGKDFAPPLFPPYTMEVDITESSRSFNIDVPVETE